MFIGAIDGGGTKVLAAVMSETGEVLARRQASVPTADYTAYFARCADMLGECAAEVACRFRSWQAWGPACLR